MAIVEQTKLRGERRIVLSGVSWELYEQLRENEAIGTSRWPTTKGGSNVL
jgi:hypothetical protein